MNRIIKKLHKVFDVEYIKVECPKCYSAVDITVEAIELIHNPYSNFEVPLYKCLKCGNKWTNIERRKFECLQLG